MKVQLKVIEVMPQRTFPTKQGDMVARGIHFSQGKDEFFGEAYGQHALTLPEGLGGGDYVWCDLSFQVNKREHEGKTYYEQRVQISNVKKV